MTDTINMNQTTMLGTYTLDGNVPVDPEIVLSDCQDTAMLGRLVGMFAGDAEIRFFLLPDVDRAALDMGADFHFIKDSGNWVLANSNTMHNVLFDDAGFNPGGQEGTFSIALLGDGSYAVHTGADPAPGADLPHDGLLVDLPEHDIFAAGHTAHHIGEGHTDGHELHAGANAGDLFIDPSVLAHGQSEIVISNFTLGSNHLELPDTLSVKDVVVDHEHDLTSVILAQNDHTGDDIVVKLLGVSHPDMPGHDIHIDADHSGDDLITHLIHSGRHME
ncbi:hypothetical protein BerOc1_00768 [Pseudodesulfovibrio hydrargyri]|uniref:Uncharacterized protein n=1 Tax=Pseudodesulfovibrio hydrargyri TaxID=2125990 RepID=A0A1J5N0H3_9BACT|nr:hypothetical protein [Pseudodesulfovibrio hydrargyri]OIQ52293.1 hypothetical protein BerOc1_00768 [Pseudodesulfovibrio hydrargyri]